MGFSPEVRLWFESSSASPFAGLDVSVLGLEASIEPGPIPTVKEEEVVVERPADPLPAPTSSTKGPIRLGPRRLGMPQSR